MALLQNFVAVILATATGFSSGVSDINVIPPVEKAETVVGENVDIANSIAQSGSMSAGIAVYDRATKSLSTNNSGAHRQYEMKTLGRLPILLYIARTDKSVGRGTNKDAIEMIQGYSGEATNRLWAKNGGKSIIRDLIKRYKLQETKPGDNWDSTVTTAVDVTRMYRRFLDDDAVSTKTKKWVLNILGNTSLSVAGEDFSWGLPSAVGIENNEDQKSERLARWAQGWSDSGSDPMIRATTGIYGSDFRFIVVIIGQVPKSTPNDAANRVTSQVATAVIQGSGETSLDNATGISSKQLDMFGNKQKRLYGDGSQ